VARPRRGIALRPAARPRARGTSRNGEPPDRSQGYNDSYMARVSQRLSQEATHDGIKNTRATRRAAFADLSFICGSLILILESRRSRPDGFATGWTAGVRTRRPSSTCRIFQIGGCPLAVPVHDVTGLFQLTIQSSAGPDPGRRGLASNES